MNHCSIKENFTSSNVPKNLDQNFGRVRGEKKTIQKSFEKTKIPIRIQSRLHLILQSRFHLHFRSAGRHRITAKLKNDLASR